jgi:hypothetical protein
VKQLSAASGLLVVLVVTAHTSFTSSAAAAGEHPQVNPDRRLLTDFKRRVGEYIEVRKKAEAQVPPLKKTTKDPAEIRLAQEALAQRIRALRANAKHGDIFTVEISGYFRRLLRPTVTDKTTKQTIFDDNPGNIPYLKVNAVYPDDKPLSTVPPDVLMTLPVLPDDIEYRFVGKHMILRDARANLIIDYIPDVIP